MLKTIQKLMGILFTCCSDHKHETTVVKPEATLKLKKELSMVRQEKSEWMKKAASLQDKLSASQGHVTVLEDVLEESNRTIEALNLALELREKEETSGLQTYIDELETEIDEAVDLIQKYGLELRKA